MGKILKEIIIIILALAVIAATLACYSMKRNAIANRVKAEEGLSQGKITKIKAEEELHRAEQDRDALEGDVDKVRQRAESFDAELSDCQESINYTETKLSEIDAEAALAQSKIESFISELEDIKNRITNIVKDTLKISDESSLLENTTDALKKKLKEYQAGNVSDNIEAVGSLEGEVLTVNKEFRFIVISLGAKHGVKEGMDFEIARDGKKIGEARVETVRENISAAAISDEIVMRSIRPGDIVIK